MNIDIKDHLVKHLLREEKKYRDTHDNNLDSKFYSDELKERLHKKFIALSSLEEWEDWDDSVEFFTKYYDIAIKEHKSKTVLTIKKSKTLKSEVNKWLTDDVKKSIGWGNIEIKTYRDRYFEYLKKIGRSDKIINETKRSTLSIIEGFGDPNSDSSFYKKGLVVGSVQSGKTANFNGVINTAVDVGYKMVIVLSGIMEDLRVQTQSRLEKEVIGTIGRGGKGKGVGEDHPFRDNLLNSITSVDTDFKRNILDVNFNIHSNKNIIVCKKNVSVLKNILLWLSEYIDEENKQIDLPLLIIDDEADNASLNNLGAKGKEYATKTNQEIRAILNLFSKKVYLGYTATPFANIFQDRNEEPDFKLEINFKGEKKLFSLVDNIFPDHFIELLYPPSNYVGIKHFFDTKSDKINKISSLIAPPINEDDPDYYLSIPPRFYKDSLTPTTSLEAGITRSAKKDDMYPNRENGIPKSLKEAILCFVLSIAIKTSRQSEMIKTPFFQPHDTMLIHISLFADWQNRLRDLVESYVRDITIKLSNDSLNSGIWLEFERIWNKHYEYIVNNIKAELPADYNDDYLTPKNFKKDILPLLNKSIIGIEVVAINSYTNDNLDYSKSPKKYIAIGGNRLSRGFTLEGLTINYFLRKANTADTLMQMGRWFGYRPGYLDCCKLFTTSDNIEKFNSVSITMEDLEERFAYLSDLPGRTPSDYTIWVKNNPKVIKLTRSNFLKGIVTKSLDFSDTVQQSTHFDMDKKKIEYSFEKFIEHVKKIDWIKDKEIDPSYLFYDTDQKGLLEFIHLPNVMRNLDIQGLEQYLEECRTKGVLKNWRVAIKIIKKSDARILKKEKIGLNHDVRLIKRSGPSWGKNPNQASHNFNYLINHNIFKARNSTIITPTDFSITLTEEEKKKVETSFKQKKGNEKKLSVPDKAYRDAMDSSTGILMIYLMDIQKIFYLEKDPMSTKVLQEYSKEKGFDKLVDTPLIGYAIGFPKIKGIDGGTFITKHSFKELEDMNLEELKVYAEERDFNIDLNQNWSRKDLLSELQGIEEEEDIDSDKLLEDIND